MPSTRKNSSIVSVVHEICCGIDVHKNTIVACLVRTEIADGERSDTFSPFNLVPSGIRSRSLSEVFPCRVVAGNDIMHRRYRHTCV